MTEMTDLEMKLAFEAFKASFLRDLDDRLASKVDPVVLDFSESRERLQSINIRLLELEQGRTLTGRLKRLLRR
jgi:hypothetical protein